MKKRILIAGWLTLGTVVCIHGATLLGLRYPLGIPCDPQSGMSASMGGAMTGVAADNNLMLGNPGNLGNVTKAVFISYVSVDYTRIGSKNGTSTNLVDFVPQQVSFAFPLGNVGAIGLSCNRSVDLAAHFGYTIKASAADIETIDSVNLGFVREGSLTNWEAGWGYSIGKWAQVGLSYKRFYLSIKNLNRVLTYGALNEWTQDSARAFMGGNAINGGIMVPFAQAVIGIAGSYSFEDKMTVNDRLSGGAIALDSSTKSVKVKLPPSLAIGGSYKFSPEWFAAADLKGTYWKGYVSELPLTGTSSAALNPMALSFSLGGQYIPSPNLLMPRYWETIQYRAGMRFAQMPIKDAVQWSFDLGTGLPLPSGGGLIDIVLGYDIRSDKSYPDYSEQVVKLGIGFNGGHKWVKATQSTY